MIVDAHSIDPGAVVDTDVCIVGGGTAGITLAREFIGAPFEVLLLESGGMTPDADTKSLHKGDNIGFPYYALDEARARVFGGSCTLWDIPIGQGRVGPRLRPLDPIDFEARDWVPYSGWPFDRGHLDPFYDRAQAVCRVGPRTYDAHEWADADSRPLLPWHDDAGVETVVYKVCDGSLFVSRYRKDVGNSENVTTCLYANVLEIESNDAGTFVNRLRVSPIGGPEFFVAAKVVVLAAGGIETPRLMLLSNGTNPAGLGNDHDLVGRFFMEHLHFWSGVLVVDDHERAGQMGFYTGVHAVNDVPVVGKLALSERVLRREKLLNQNVQLMPHSRPDPFKYRPLDPRPIESLKALGGREPIRHRAGHLRRVFTGWDDIVTAGVRKMRAKVAPLPDTPVFVLANMAEQIPNPQSRVTLGTELDALGQRRVQLDWRITPQDIRSVVRTQALLGCAFERIGLGRLHRELLDDTPPVTTHGGYHHIGTTRMHPDPARGVVDAQCRVHGFDNLYVAGPSVFPTGGYANPVLTTVALTLRLADRVKQSIPS